MNNALLLLSARCQCLEGEWTRGGAQLWWVSRRRAWMAYSPNSSDGLASSRPYTIGLFKLFWPYTTDGTMICYITRPLTKDMGTD